MLQFWSTLLITSEADALNVCPGVIPRAKPSWALLPYANLRAQLQVMKRGDRDT